MADAWKEAFDAVQQQRSFGDLNALCDVGSDADPNVSLAWDGAFLTPLFVAAWLRLDDHIPQLLALGADPARQCLFQGLLCGPLHAAALQGDVQTLNSLLDAACDPSVTAETSSLEGAESTASSFMGCNALHCLVIRDVFYEEVFRTLMRRGIRVSAPLQTRDGKEVQGLSLPSRLGNKEATEQRLDNVLGEEVRGIVDHCSTTASVLNDFLEAGASLRKERHTVGYRFIKDVDFELALDGGGDGVTALLYAAREGRSAAVRLLLYAGADATRRAATDIDLDAEGRRVRLQTQALHLAALRGDVKLVEDLVFFGVPVESLCEGCVLRTGSDDVVETWSGLNCIHLAVLQQRPDTIEHLLRCDCDIEAQAVSEKASEGSPPLIMTPLMLAVHLESVHCVAELLNRGAIVGDTVRAKALASKTLQEMFGGPSAVSFEDWLSAMLTGEPALQGLIDRRTDLSRTLDFPIALAASPDTMVAHRLASPDLVARIEKNLARVPTQLRDLRPVHLACILQQPWVLGMLVDAGATIVEVPCCREVALNDTMARDLAPELEDVQLDALFLCARVGSLQMIELLSQEPQFALDVRKEVPLLPDLTPAFYPRAGGDCVLTWAWCRLSPLELALLHGNVDAAVLLARLGADLLHASDHVAVRPPSHYSVTDGCFRGLTPLHICALMGRGAAGNEASSADACVATAALLAEAASEESPVEGRQARPSRQTLLRARCTQAWATVESTPTADKEAWLWRDLTPLHVAIIMKNTDVAEMLIDASTPETLELSCQCKDVEFGDADRSYSALLLAFERDMKDIHRRIARKFPRC
eukprot:TRINITY_DN92067_c0_g1_i1.p1 TRINITY_DN92067_c0_g1~~TRINITY_DN92067_c0_g1_i1.p1  ORF type:complete len:816 (-),score=132.65 TRINITY_DN92067_c0_g1_i1:117-2564(-)